MNRLGEHNDRNRIHKLTLTEEEYDRILAERMRNHTTSFHQWLITQFNLQPGRTYHAYVDGHPTGMYFEAVVDKTRTQKRKAA